MVLEEQRPGGERETKKEKRAEDAFDRIRNCKKPECRFKVWALGEVRLET